MRVHPRTCPRINLFIISAIAVIALLLSAASGAQASTRQQSVMQDDARLLSGDPAARDAALDEMRALGVDIVKVGAFWRRFAPSATSNRKPRFIATDPTGYSWAPLEEVVQGIVSRGMRPWIMVSAPAPDWATKKSTKSTQEGVYQPDPAGFADFTEAIGRKFPQVSIWSIYNEPNFQYWLWPQIGKGLASLSAVHYRKIYVAAHAALVHSGHGGDTILFGGLAPRAFLPRVGQRATQPLRFLRDFFCLGDDLKPLTGRAAKLRSCTGKFAKISASGFAYHPYTVAGGPSIRPTSLDDAPIANLKRVYRVLDRAAALRRLSNRRMPLWSAEFAYQSDPPDLYQTRIGKIPGFLNTSEYISYRDSRVKTYSQYQLYDEPLDTSFSVGDNDRYGGFQSGLRFADGDKKTDVYRAYQMPLMIFKRTGATVTVWGCLRAAVAGASIEIEVKQGSDWSTVGTATVNNPMGYFIQPVTVPGANGKTFRLKYNNVYSREAKPGKPVKASKK